MTQDDIYGSDEQRALLRRGRALFDILGQDPRYTYYGRTVGLATGAVRDLDHLTALARVQGNAAIALVPEAEVAALHDGLTARNLVPIAYSRWDGGSASLAAAKAIVRDLPLPAGLTMTRIDADTPSMVLASLADMALGCGVLPLAGEVLRGLLNPAVCLVAQDGEGKVVSCGASAGFAHPDHPALGRQQAYWGMLATDTAWRGRKLAFILGAHAMLSMSRNHGIEAFFTGVEPGNTPSEGVCTRLMLARSVAVILGCADPRSLRSGRMTK